MGTFQFRPKLVQLEERATPASMADVQWAYGVTQHNAATIRALSADPEWMTNPAFRSVLQQFTWMLNRQSNAAADIFTGTPGFAPILAQTQANAGVAAGIADLLGLSLTPPVAPTKPTDAGMVNTMPSISAPEWVTQANGLKTWDVVQGTGDPVATGDSITVFYTGWRAADGFKFDSKRSPSDPATFALSGLIQGWQQGIPGMKPGGIRRLYIPAALAYGATGSPPNIPPNADLVFEIKVISHT